MQEAGNGTNGTNGGAISRRRDVRSLVLRAAKERKQQALVLKNQKEISARLDHQNQDPNQICAMDDDSQETTESLALFAPFSPSPMGLIASVWLRLQQHQQQQKKKLLNADDLLVDLGCGDGRWLISAAKEFSCRALGIELDGKLVHLARQRVQQEQDTLAEKLAIEIVQQDVLQVDISQAKLVIVYAFAKSLDHIRDSLQSQLRPNALVLSIGFRIKGWKPTICERCDGLRWYFYELSRV